MQLDNKLVEVPFLFQLQVAAFHKLVKYLENLVRPLTRNTIAGTRNGKKKNGGTIAVTVARGNMIR